MGDIDILRIVHLNGSNISFHTCLFHPIDVHTLY